MASKRIRGLNVEYIDPANPLLDTKAASAALMRRQRSRANTIRGDHAQQLVAYTLRAAGFGMIQPIATPWRVTRRYDPKTKTSKIVGASPKGAVFADFMAVVPGSGRSVIVEVKLRADGVLSLSNFGKHQIAALDEHHKLGGLSLVAVVEGGRVNLLQWPISGLAKGAPVHLFYDKHGLGNFGPLLWPRAEPAAAPELEEPIR